MDIRGWPSMEGDLVDVLPNGIVIDPFTWFQATKTVIRSRANGLGGTDTDTEPIMVNVGPPRQVYSATVFIKSYPENLSHSTYDTGNGPQLVAAKPGKNIRVRAFKTTEQMPWNGKMLAVFDHGAYTGSADGDIVVITKRVTVKGGDENT